MSEPAVDRQVRVQASVVRGDPPASGPRPSPYRWTDVSRTSGPDPRTRSLGAYVVYHEMELDAEVRIAHTTRIDVFPDEGGDPPRDGSIRVDAQVNVHKRGALKSLEALRQGAASRRNHWERVVRERSDPTRATPRGPPGRARLTARRVGDPMIRGSARLAAAFWSAALALLDIPGRIVAGALEAHAVLHSKLGRRSVWAGLTEPRTLTVGQRGATVFAVAVVGLVAVLALNSLAALVFPSYAVVYRATLGLAATMVAGVLFLPVVVEPLLVISTLALGPVAAFGGMLAGKILGSWILYLIGVSLIETVRGWADLRPRMARTIDWMTDTADEHAFPLLFVGNVLPFVSGFFLYVYAVAGVRFRAWIAGVTLGTAVRFGAIIVAVYLVGPDRVSAWLVNPLG